MSRFKNVKRSDFSNISDEQLNERSLQLIEAIASGKSVRSSKKTVASAKTKRGKGKSKTRAALPYAGITSSFAPSPSTMFQTIVRPDTSVLTAPPANALSAILSALAASGADFEPSTDASLNMQSAALHCGGGVAKGLSHEDSLRLFRVIQPSVPVHLLRSLSKTELCALLGDEIVAATVQELCAGRMANQADTKLRLIEVLSVLTGIKRQALQELTKEELCANIAARLTNSQNFQILSDTGGSPTLMGAESLNWSQAGEGGSQFLAALAGLGGQAATSQPPAAALDGQQLQAILAGMPKAPPPMPAPTIGPHMAAPSGFLGQALSQGGSLLKDIGKSAAAMPFQEFTRYNDSPVLRGIRMAGGMFGLEGDDRVRFLQQNWGAVNRLMGGQDAGLFRKLLGVALEAGVNKDKSEAGAVLNMIPDSVKTMGGWLGGLAKSMIMAKLAGGGVAPTHVAAQEKVTRVCDKKLWSQAHLARASLITRALSRMHRPQCCRECSDVSCRRHCMDCVSSVDKPIAEGRESKTAERGGHQTRASRVTRKRAPKSKSPPPKARHRSSGNRSSVRTGLHKSLMLCA
eukprot:jgi/Mesvir1/29557/Mv21368-RA.1